MTLDNHINVKSEDNRTCDSITEVSYDPELDSIMLDKLHYFNWQDIRKRFIIYTDVLEKFGYPIDELVDKFYRYYTH